MMERAEKEDTRYRQSSKPCVWQWQLNSIQYNAAFQALCSYFCQIICERYNQILDKKSSGKFLPLEFGFPQIETYALYTSLDGAHPVLYFLNQTPTGM